MIQLNSLQNITKMDEYTIPDILLINHECFSSELVSELKVACCGNKMSIITISNKPNLGEGFTYNLLYDNTQNIEISNNIILTIANTKKLSNTGKNIINYSNQHQELEEQIFSSRKDVFAMMKNLLEFIENKDKYTKKHSLRVAKYARLLADQMKLPLEEKNEIYEAALLHDIGKIGISDHVLTKNGPLSDEEFEHMRKHVEISKSLLPTTVFGDIYNIIKYHHEKYNGTGYPHGISGNDIPIGARILILADAFDAMTTKRNYNEEKTLNDAIGEIIRCSGTQFDPEVVEAFLDLILNNNELQDYFYYNETQRHEPITTNVQSNISK